MSASTLPKILSAATLLVALSLTGCTDMITFAGKNRDSGMEAYNQARYSDAAGAFRAALREDPRDFRSHYYLGLCSLQLGSYQKAVVAFRSCLDTRKLTSEGQNDTDMALKAMDGLAQAILKSDDADLEVNKVEQLARQSKGAAAGQEFFVLAKVYRYRMLPDMSLDFYNRACLADNTNFDFLKEYGLYLEQLQQKQRAEQALRQAYALSNGDPEVTTALMRLGVVPGPSLKNKDDLAKPLMPKGPIPEMDMKKVKSALGIGGEEKAVPAGAPTRTSVPTAATPRD